MIQSAGNCTGSSETIRQCSNLLKPTPLLLAETPARACCAQDHKTFYSWFAGVLDGDGNFDLRKDPLTKKLVLKTIRIKLHNRDIRILTRIQNFLHFGRIRSDKNKPYCV